MEDSATDGFFVPDGQLSEDEGISSAQQEVDELCAQQLGMQAVKPYIKHQCSYKHALKGAQTVETDY